MPLLVESVVLEVVIQTIRNFDLLRENHLLKHRLVSSYILVQSVICALFLLSPFYFAIITLGVCVIASWEWCKLSGFTKCIEYFWTATFCSLLLILVFFLIPKYHINIHHFLVMFLLCISLIWWITALFLVISYPFSASIWCTSKVLRLIFGLFTIVPFFGGMIILRAFHYDTNYYSGALCILYIMILVWGIDIGSYIFGKLFGKHKLAPQVSPGKTWQGFIGGLSTATIFSYLYWSLVDLEVTPLVLVICSVPSALAAIIGDLTESMFKREVGIKDSSHFIPGHGGLLDRIDSLMAALPVFTSLLMLVCKKI